MNLIILNKTEQLGGIEAFFINNSIFIVNQFVGLIKIQDFYKTFNKQIQCDSTYQQQQFQLYQNDVENNTIILQDNIINVRKLKIQQRKYISFKLNNQIITVIKDDVEDIIQRVYIGDLLIQQANVAIKAIRKNIYYKSLFIIISADNSIFVWNINDFKLLGVDFRCKNVGCFLQNIIYEEFDQEQDKMKTFLKIVMDNSIYIYQLPYLQIKEIQSQNTTQKDLNLFQ